MCPLLQAVIVPAIYTGSLSEDLCVKSNEKIERRMGSSLFPIWNWLEIDRLDPVPALVHYQVLLQRTMRIQDLEIENRHLRETLNDYSREFKVVRNQGESTYRNNK
ncbi:homeobox protein cut-like [Caerostris darwini]|uniref:Homeobox protein cut-like n=1 Tax=Caerostris darwini TaxID=1538125 RepID=A0AAV4N0D4_9ARAC|nr:homeobox protein cut-like [Caerostris darwini]